MQNQHNPDPESTETPTPGFAELARFAAALPQDYRLALLLMLHFALDEEKASPLKESNPLRLAKSNQKRKVNRTKLEVWPSQESDKAFQRRVDDFFNREEARSAATSQNNG